MTRRRTGTTLMEVLMAIFIMAVGLTSVMALFPVGAVSMARAVQDVRSADSAANAVSMFRMRWKRAIDESSNPGSRHYRPTSMYYPAVAGSYSPEPFIPALDNPNTVVADATGVSAPTSPANAFTLYHPTFAGLPANSPSRAGGLAPTTGFPSYPVLIDPVGYLAQAAKGTQAQNWIPSFGGKTAKYTPIPRRSITDLNQLAALSAAGSTALPSITDIGRAARLFTQLDDMSFDNNGLPKPGLERRGKYTWAWLARRDSNSRRNSVSLSVMVFRDRSTSFPSTELAFAGRTIPGSPNQIMLFLSSPTAPPLRKGGWLLDATVSDQRVEGFFYRVVNVSDVIQDSNGTSVRVEFQTPVRSPSAAPDNRNFVFFEGLVEVFEKGPIDMENAPRPY